MDLQISPQLTRSLIDQFRALALQLRDLIGREGAGVIPWNDPALPNFSQLPEERQLEVIQNLQAVVRGCLRVKARGGNLWNTALLLEHTLAEMGLTASPDLYKRLEENNYLSVYNRTQQMIFISINHFEMVSYSIEELYCRPWMELFRRHESIERILIERAVSFVIGRRNEIISNEDIPLHTLIETESPQRRAFLAQSKLYAPILREGRPAGFVAVNRGKGCTTDLAKKFQRLVGF